LHCGASNSCSLFLASQVTSTIKPGRTLKAERSVMGQTAKNSQGAFVFRFASELRHCSTRSALRVCANRRHSKRKKPQSEWPLTSACFFNECSPLVSDDTPKYTRRDRTQIGIVTWRKHIGPRGRSLARIGQATYGYRWGTFLNQKVDNFASVLHPGSLNSRCICPDTSP
jgi:hypothetical protein